MGHLLPVYEKLVPVFNHPLCKKLLPYRSTKSTLSLKPFKASPPIATGPAKKLSTERLQKRVTEAFSSPDGANPTLSAFPSRRGVPSFWSFLWPSSSLAPEPVYIFPVLKTAELDVLLQTERRPLGGRITCHNLLDMFLLMHPRIQLTFWVAGTH